MCSHAVPGRARSGGRGSCAPLVGIFLHHGDDTPRALGPKEALARCSRNVLFFARNGRHGSGLGIAADLVEAVPSSISLSARPGFWEVIRNA